MIIARKNPRYASISSSLLFKNTHQINFLIHMRSVLRTVLISVSSIFFSSTTPPLNSSFSKIVMGSSTASGPANFCGGSPRLMALAQQLRLYKPPPTFEDDDDDDDKIENEEKRLEETAGKVVSQVGFAESVTPVAHQQDRFRPKRAAVLICLFEGDAGEYRVILTKRSSKLSTHSGLSLLRAFACE